MQTAPEFDPVDVKVARILHTMAHPVCLNIVDCLSGGPRRMLDISESVKMLNGPNLWRYVKRMVESGVVVKCRMGKQIYYRLLMEDVSGMVSLCRHVGTHSFKNF